MRVINQCGGAPVGIPHRGIPDVVINFHDDLVGKNARFFRNVLRQQGHGIVILNGKIDFKKSIRIHSVRRLYDVQSETQNQKPTYHAFVKNDALNCARIPGLDDCGDLGLWGHLSHGALVDQLAAFVSRILPFHPGRVSWQL